MRIAVVALLGCGRLHFDPVPSDSAVSHELMYVIDGNKSALRIFDIDATGALAESAASPFDLGIEPYALLGNPAGTRLYVTSVQTASLYTYAIDGATGALVLLDQQPTGVAPEMIAIDANARWLYVPDYSSSSRVDGFALDPSGMPTPMPGSPFSFAGTDADWVEVHPSGQWAYVLEASLTKQLHAMAIAPATGALSPLGVSPWPVPDSDPHAALIDSTGRFGFIANDLMQAVPGFTIDPMSGAISTTPGSPFGAMANTCMAAAMDATRHRLFVADDGSGTNALDAYVVVQTTGALSLLTNSPRPTNNVMWWVATSPSGNDVYTTTSRIGPAIRHFRADDTTLTELETYDFPSLDHAGRLTLVRTP